MQHRIVAAAIVALGFGTFCTTKDKDYNEADLPPGGFAGGPGSSTATSAATSTTASGGTTSGPTCSGTVCTPRTVEQALILDFEGDGDGAAGAAGATGNAGLGTFGDFGSGFSGGIFAYGEGLDSVVEDGAWHLSGSAGQGSGFGLYLNCESDASAYSGIEFTIRGDAGPGQINMLIETSSNITDACQGGTCSGNCLGAAAAVNHTPGEQTLTFAWEDFQDGAPDDTPDPTEITAVRWEFQAAGPFPVDFTIDDIRFVE